jgi:hypothetical protein
LKLLKLIERAMLHGISEKAEPSVEGNEAGCPSRNPLPGGSVAAFQENGVPEQAGAKPNGEKPKRGLARPGVVVIGGHGKKRRVGPVS